MTLNRYYRAFGAFGWVVVSALGALPLVSKLLPEHIGGYLFPPLGHIESPARFATIALMFGVTYLVYLLKDLSAPWRRYLAVTFVLLAFFFCCGYFALAIRFVKVVPIPSLHTSVSLSVGYERTDFARALGEEDDVGLLRSRGPEEEEIQRLWTLKSLIIARLLLWMSYTGVLSFFVGMFSLGAIQHAREQLSPAECATV